MINILKDEFIYFKKDPLKKISSNFILVYANLFNHWHSYK